MSRKKTKDATAKQQPVYELSEYEERRLERIRKNEAYMESLGLKSAKSKLLQEMTQKTKRNQQRAKQQRRLVKKGEERRSRRVVQKGKGKKNKNDDDDLVMLSYDDQDDILSLAAVKQGDYYADNITTSTPNSYAQQPSRRRLSYTTTYDREDFVLTQAEKDILWHNTMDQNYLHKFQEFLVYHNKINPQNVRNVMRQVTKLATGQGVRYESEKYGWKLPHQIFQKGTCVTPLSDFVLLLELAREAEDLWGRNRGNGWLLAHPLIKLLLFQQFCLQNPDFLKEENKSLGEYYATQITGDGDEEDDEEDDEEESKTEEEDESKTETDTTTTNSSSSNSPPVTETETTKKAVTAKKKRGRPSKTMTSVGRRVAKDFDGTIYLGTVAQHDRKSKYWFIVYDDGDEEELDANDLQEALDLFQQQQQQPANDDDDGEDKIGTVKQPRSSSSSSTNKKGGRPKKKRKH